MPYAISWIGTKTEPPKKYIGPTLYKHIRIKGQDTSKKVPMTKEDAEKLCERANEDSTYGGLEHTVVKVNERENIERENIERENSDEKILGRKFWRENFDIMIEGRE